VVGVVDELDTRSGKSLSETGCHRRPIGVWRSPWTASGPDARRRKPSRPVGSPTTGSNPRFGQKQWPAGLSHASPHFVRRRHSHISDLVCLRAAPIAEMLRLTEDGVRLPVTRGSFERRGGPPLGPARRVADCRRALQRTAHHREVALVDDLDDDIVWDGGDSARHAREAPDASVLASPPCSTRSWPARR
jgi:hypothetical protein